MKKNKNKKNNNNNNDLSHTYEPWFTCKFISHS
jgi:hypothetical protein